MRPGTYLSKRRVAAGLAVSELAEQLARLPWAIRPVTADEIDRLEALLRAAEEGKTLLGRPQVELVRAIFPFDIGIYLDLVEIDAAPGCAIPHPQLCRDCACSWHDPCQDECGPCAWAEADLCTRCLRIQTIEAELVPAPLRHLRAVAAVAERQLADPRRVERELAGSAAA